MSYTLDLVIRCSFTPRERFAIDKNHPLARAIANTIKDRRTRVIEDREEMLIYKVYWNEPTRSIRIAMYAPIGVFEILEQKEKKK